ncbi:MAG: peroxiredoxin [Deltaproteobacteria bacterium]|nr:peroxiredoxin [Deltaproteobacteria bacterium]
MLKEGDKAPDFTLKGIDEAGDEKEFSLNDRVGKKAVIYFYPKDNTSGCTQEACDFRDNMARITATAVMVLGVSPDTIESHKGFQEKHGLPFPLLSDPGKTTAAEYNAYGEKESFGKTVKGIIRSTFLIGEDGRIKRLWRDVKVAGHVDEVLSALKG